MGRRRILSSQVRRRRLIPVWSVPLLVMGSVALWLLWSVRSPVRPLPWAEGYELVYGGEISAEESLRLEPMLFLESQVSGGHEAETVPVLGFSGGDWLQPQLLRDRAQLSVASPMLGGHDIRALGVSSGRPGYVPQWASSADFTRRSGAERRLVARLSPSLKACGLQLPETVGMPDSGGAWEAMLWVQVDARGRVAEVMIQQGPENDLLCQWLERQVAQASALAGGAEVEGWIAMAYGYP